MKKLLFVPILLVIVLFGFSACNDDDKSSVYYVWDEPAVVDSLENMPVIKTAYGTYYAPGLKDDVEKGSHLWVSFILDQNKPKEGSFFTANNLRYKEIGTSEIQMISGELPGNEDLFTDSIDVSLLYNSYIGNHLYFGFKQDAPEGQKFDYVLYCNTDSVFDGIPTLYIKSKKSEPAAGSVKKVWTNYGFDMTDFLSSEFGTKPVKFNIKYKIGTINGKDVYKPFDSNPINWNIKTELQN